MPPKQPPNTSPIDRMAEQSNYVSSELTQEEQDLFLKIRQGYIDNGYDMQKAAEYAQNYVLNLRRPYIR